MYFCTNLVGTMRTPCGWRRCWEEMVGAYRPALLALTLATAPRAADRLHQRGGAAARAGGCAPAGAGGMRRQLLTESAMLGAGGGVLRLVTAPMVLRTVPALVPGDVARLDEAWHVPKHPRLVGRRGARQDAPTRLRQRCPD